MEQTEQSTKTKKSELNFINDEDYAAIYLSYINFVKKNMITYKI